jgi:hypothetical protein
MCSIDPNLIVAGAAVVTAAAAVIALGVSAWQAHFTTGVQALLQLEARWSSGQMLKTRRSAAASLLNGKPNSDVDTVLDFFESIAGVFVKGRWPIIRDQWVWHTFYWYAVCYWSKSRDLINATQQSKTEHNAWVDLGALMPRWIKLDGGEAPTQENIDSFLRSEFIP